MTLATGRGSGSAFEKFNEKGRLWGLAGFSMLAWSKFSGSLMPSDRRSAVYVCSLAILLFGRVLALAQAPSQEQRVNEVNTVMMQSTFLIEGLPDSTGQTNYGTAFLIGRPLKDDPQTLAFVFVTAKHVMESLPGDVAVLNFRHLDPQTGVWLRDLVRLGIRNNGVPLWTSHPTADVVSMYVRLPTAPATSLVIVSMALLADDEMLAKLDVHPGDEVNCLGFPMHAQSNEAGFPVLRSGKIASYPLTPTKTVKSFLMDFAVFPGNSGGPVYFVSSNRVIRGAMTFGVSAAVLGIVIQENYVTEKIIGRATTAENRTYLNLATVVHAALIKEVVEMLPEPKP